MQQHECGRDPPTRAIASTLRMRYGFLMAPRDEYTSLRAEILDWQRRRTVVTMQTAAVVATILGVVTSFAKSFMWTALSATLLALLTASMIFARYAADAASRLGTDLQVVHERETGGWEGRRSRLGIGRTQNLNTALAAIYITLGVLATVVPVAAATNRGQPWYGWLLLAVASVLFLTVATGLAYWSYQSRADYLQKWENILREDESSSTPSRTPLENDAEDEGS